MVFLNSVPGFLKLPLELMHEIISDIDAHADLMAVALTCRSFAHLVIPGHAEYRIIRVRHPLSPMWNHLSKRRDLARNIREVHFCDRNDYSASDRWPKRLVEGSPSTDEVTRIKNICMALHHMDNLAVFTWSALERQASPAQNPLHEDAILQALCGKPSLKKLAMVGTLGNHAVGANLDPKSVVYPLWRINNLTSITLSGDAFLKSSNSSHVRTMLNRSSATLQHLEVPLELQVLSDCRFTNLRRLKLRLLSGANVSIDRSRVQFLANNPSIEELAWLPLGCCEISPDILPNLKRVQTTMDVACVLCKSVTPRAFEVLEVPSLDATTLLALENLDRGALRKVTLYHFDSLGQLHSIASLFPNLTSLSITRSSVPIPPNADGLLQKEWAALLCRFPFLETFRGQVLWDSVARDKMRMHALIGELALRCPRLRVLDHCEYYAKRRDWQRVVIFRQVDDDNVEHVRYEIQRPPPV
ncbi:hypothetical protein BD626DRAFT_399244 [Schizophyllum amplum]|uniref:F-box domain-containing protein n=1 Tax=Schizophyllum amplum TaxID=97359 RepID=A0A550CKX0_9AGAR|nr:hypothetical protein BD626DRAFT_399244 [Auriculariopsis ampla]